MADRPYTLQANIAGRDARLTSAGTPVTALGAGSYTIVVRDRSANAGFRFVTSGFNRHTTARFRGKAIWHVRLSPYDTARYGPVSGRPKLISVLGDGGA